MFKPNNIPTPEPSGYQRKVPASDVTDTQNRTRLFTPEDGVAAEDAKQRMEGIWLKAQQRVAELVPVERQLTIEYQVLDAEATRLEDRADRRQELADARIDEWSPATRNLRRETRLLGPGALVACALVEFVLALVAWVALVGDLNTGSFVDIALKPGPLISAAGLALVSAIAVHIAGTGLAEYLERKRLAPEDSRSPSTFPKQETRRTR